MRRATELIDTPYVAMLGDDDLFTKSGLKKCLDHLEGNSEVFGVVGRSMFFSISAVLFLVSRNIQRLPTMTRKLRADCSAA